MELHAYARTISDLFSVKRQYLIPRFQRPYSWKKEQIKELWKDIRNSIFYENNNFVNTEYFIGSLVLIGDDKSRTHQIVDGQQRLTTITILLSVLCERFKELGKLNIAEAIYENYIAGKDDDGEYYFKLVNEHPKPFFQTTIQHIDKQLTNEPSSDEELTLYNSYKELYLLTSKDKLSSDFKEINLDDDKNYEMLLKVIRDQIVKYLKVIFITVAEEEEAYTIFETLNARGMNLSFVDLIKNKLFKTVRVKHPDDLIKTKWKEITNSLGMRDNVGSLEDYMRHFWISKYKYVAKAKIYKSFQEEFDNGDIDVKEFINNLCEDAKIYKIISSPISSDFPLQHEKVIYSSLLSLKSFGILQHKPFLLSLFRARSKKIISHSKVVETLQFLEKFHFIFNAVCKMSTNKLERPYASKARALNKEMDNNKAIDIINELIKNFKEKLPDNEIFEDAFKKLKFLNGFTKDKKLIQYIFNKIENCNHPTNEFVPHNITLEHILSQSTSGIQNLGHMGNLLPLGALLNEDAKDYNLEKKMKIYSQSEYYMTKTFAKNNLDKKVWEEADIETLTIELSTYCYSKIWKI